MIGRFLLSDAPKRDQAGTSRLLVFFALVYLVEGVGQVGGLIAQPLSYYLKQVHGWTPLQVTAYLAIFNLPWVIKPVYGLISDFVPLFGYRRKSYLLIANVAAIAGFFWATQIDTPSVLVFALMMTAYAMAISSTLCGAVLVQNGQKLQQSGRFVNQQWLWSNMAAMAAAIVGGLFYGLAGLGQAARGKRNSKEQTALVSDLLMFVLLGAFVAIRGF